MENLEYRKLRDLGRKEFNKINHNKNLQKLINKDFDNIATFLKNDRKFIEDYQLKKIKKLVDYAYTNIPLYREKYDKIGYKVGDIKTFDDFYKIPILYKEELIDGFPNDIVKDVVDYKFSTRSSGSSGRFVTLAVDIDAIYTDTLQGIRQFINQSNNNYTKDKVVLFIYTCPWWIKDINNEYRLDYLPTTTNPKDAIKYIKEHRPFMISTYPTYLQRFCELGIDLSDYGVEYVIVHSEQSTREFRKEMAKRLNVVILDEYSSEELTRIALECHNQNYHIEEDSSYIEVLDIKTHERLEHGTGVVVGTNLLNMATPLIRYYQGDIVSIDSTKKCACGNNGRILTKINGREMDCIISEGKTIAASSFIDLAYNWFLTYKIPIQGIKYQIVQTSLLEICIYLKKGLYNLTEKDFLTMKQSMYSLVSKNIKISIKFTDDFIYKSNKFKPVLNLIGDKNE